MEAFVKAIKLISCGAVAGTNLLDSVSNRSGQGCWFLAEPTKSIGSRFSAICAIQAGEDSPFMAKQMIKDLREKR